ncbi:MAG TPA: class I SAM-dependent methyltransferase [Solirubrobacteraceae bacterium]
MTEGDERAFAGGPVAREARSFSRYGRHVIRLGAEVPRRLERRRLLARLPKHALCAEIGTWRGDFAETILRSRHPRTLHLIDPWEHRGEDAYERALFGGGALDGQGEMDAIYDGVLQRFRSAIESGQVKVRRSRSVEAAADFPDESLDWVYIDGDHTYEAVKADLAAYARAVKPGGLLAGDDYGLAGWWGDGVTRAVDEFAANARLTIIGTQFLLEKPS